MRAAGSLLRLLLPLLLMVGPSLVTPAFAAERHWSEGVWYEIFVRSFQDSDGDGVGDLQGVIRRLPYLAELGVDGIWLMPIHPSPSYHGYDVTDYREVNPDYGTLDDVRELVGAAHARGIRVILDFVPNHTSNRHPWFEAALAGDPAYRDWYLWAHDPPDWRGTRGGSAWHRTDGGHYLGLFSPAMPDLDHRNPAVVEEMTEILRFWLELGVDGFRVDAIQHIVESETGQISNTPGTYAWVRELEAFLHEAAPHAFLVGETWTEMPAIVRYHREANLDMSFDYPLWRNLLGAIQARSAADLGDTVAQAQQLYPPGAARGTFISNHDQTRPATLLSFPRRDEGRLKLAAGLLLTLPGTPFLYYGDEIGMPDGPGSADVEKRTPMRWEAADADGRFGFSRAEPWTDPGAPTPGVNVAEQRADDGSIWHAYRRLIGLRHDLPALARGDFELLSAGPRALLAARRSAAGPGGPGVGGRSAAGGSVVLLANLSTREVSVELAELGVTAEGVAAVHQPLVAESARAAVLVGGSVAVPPLGLVLLELE